MILDYFSSFSLFFSLGFFTTKKMNIQNPTLKSFSVALFIFFCQSKPTIFSLLIACLGRKWEICPCWIKQYNTIVPSSTNIKSISRYFSERLRKMKKKICWCSTLNEGYTVGDGRVIGETNIVLPLAWNISDHVPYAVKIDTRIPKYPIFRFENIGVEMEGFSDLVSRVLSVDPGFDNPAKCISFKLKFLRKSLLKWSKNLSKLTTLLVNCNNVLNFLDLIEEQRPLGIY